MRVLVVSAVTVILLLGAVPLAVPGVPRLHGVPPLVATGVLVLAGVAFLLGLVLLAGGRHVRRRAEATAHEPERGAGHEPTRGAGHEPAVGTAGRGPVLRPPPSPPAAGYVTVRTRW